MGTPDILLFMSKKTLSQRFAERLQAIIDQKGITRSKLAELAAMSRGNVTRHLSGIHAPSGATLEKLSEVLDVDPCELICEPKEERLKRKPPKGD